jgi:hypothetical protein
LLLALVFHCSTGCTQPVRRSDQHNSGSKKKKRTKTSVGSNASLQPTSNLQNGIVTELKRPRSNRRLRPSNARGVGPTPLSLGAGAILRCGPIVTHRISATLIPTRVPAMIVKIMPSSSV